MRAGLLGILAVAAAACGCAAEPVAIPKIVAAGAGGMLRPVNGPELRAELAAVDAEVVLLNVWATWCVTCREEFPDLLRLRRDYRDRGVAVEFVSGDFPSQIPEVSAFLRELDVDFPTYIKTGKDMELIDALHPDWSGALPATFIFARGGAIRQWWEGAATYATFAAAVDAVLEEGRKVP